MNAIDQHFKKSDYPILVADIGGTNARFATVSSPHSETIIHEATNTEDHQNIDSAILKSLGQPASRQMQTAIIAIAAPVTGNRIPLTNASWVIEPLKLIDNLGLKKIIIVNDFEAQALALPGLKDQHLEQIGNGISKPNATKFILGPGTGLGAASLIYAAGSWVPVPGEGGHVELGPVTAEDFEIFKNIERVGGRLGAEHILSGTGLPRLASGVSKTLNINRIYHSAAEITRAATEDDEAAVKALQVFARALGRVAGDFALTLLARGGIYLTGGVTPRIADFLKDGAFRAAFEAKAPHENLMRSIPTFIVRHPNPALEGLAAFARTPEKFTVSLNGRCWSNRVTATSSR